ncbi:MAG: ABC transporter ATP-binding protein [Gemmatimonadota bacterium]
MIRYEGFAKRYGQVEAVRDLTMEVRDGETLALIGPNGSGKTTCLKGALGLIRPSEGSVDVAGRDPFSDPGARAAIGYLPQRLGFPEGATAEEILHFHAGLRGADVARVGDLLDRFGLADAGSRRADTFSGGMRQRLGLAVTLVGDPEALVLDEPSAALDPSASLAIRDALGALREQSRTLVFSSHDLAEVGTLADRVAVFVAGELRALGSPRELAASFGLPSRLRLAVSAGGAGVAEAALRAGAQDVSVADDVLSCRVAPGAEAGVLEALRALGAPLGELSVTEPGVEDVYRAITAPAPRLVA